jgi:hypothetical protein
MAKSPDSSVGEHLDQRDYIIDALSETSADRWVFRQRRADRPAHDFFRQTFPAFEKKSQLGVPIAHRRPRDQGLYTNALIDELVASAERRITAQLSGKALKRWLDGASPANTVKQ